MTAMNETTSDLPLGSSNIDRRTSPHDALAHIVCNICQRQFSRTEHLRRHISAHRQERPYGCNYCSKTFTRKDAAKRHQQAHEPTSNTSKVTQVHGKLCRTCSACAKSRVKCSGGSPCNHCSARNLECVYPSRKRRRGLQDLSSNVFEPTSALLTVTNPTNIVDESQDNDAAISKSCSEEDTSLRRTSSQILDSGELLNESGTERTPSFVHELDHGSSDIAHELDVSIVGAALHVGQELPMPFETWHQEPTATNWLPFDHSSLTSNPSPPLADGTPSESVEVSILQQNPTDVRVDWNHELDVGIAIQHSTFSELIHSMGSRLPGLSDPVDHCNNTDDSEEAIPGTFYSNGAGSRVSQSERRILARQARLGNENGADISLQGIHTSWLKHLQQKADTCAADAIAHFSMPDAVHLEVIAKMYPTPNLSLLSSYQPGDVSILLRKTTLEYFIRHYFENFHPLYPFLDRSLLCIPVWGWILCLATAAIGARWVNIPNVAVFGDNLCNVVHEILLGELDLGTGEDSLPYEQARVLAAVGLCHSSNRELMARGYSATALVCNSCSRLRLLEEDDQIGAYQYGQTLEQVWIAWRFRETRRRTGLVIWLMDNMLASMAGLAPRISFRALKLRIPCRDDLWEAETYQAWIELHKQHHPSDTSPTAFSHEEQSRVSFQDTVKDLCRHRQISQGLPELASIAVICTLTSRLWDVRRYLDDTFRPGALEGEQESQIAIHNYTIEYPGVVPEYGKWRNNMCDYLDVLHWEALSLSAKAEGLEGPIFLQLHLARLLILTPWKEALDHVTSRVRSHVNNVLPQELFNVPEPAAKCLRTLDIWTRKDKYKARLAAVHAGAIFWHVRRYSADVPSQAFAIFLAAVTLWTFGSFSVSVAARTNARPGVIDNTVVDSPSEFNFSISENQSHTTENQTNESRAKAQSYRKRVVGSASRMPNSMQLDRPMDDELVQHFIRRGETIKLSLEGVNDLVSAEGPTQVLHEAVSILDESSNIWSIADNYALCLDALARSSG